MDRGTKKMKVLELFAGSRSFSKQAEKLGYNVFTTDINNFDKIDYIVDVLDTHGALMYCHGNVLKYTGSRLFNKGKTVEDARKAIWYLNKIVEIVESND